MHNSGVSRGAAEFCLDVIASAAKQSILSLRDEMDCFASLAMTVSKHMSVLQRRSNGDGSVSQRIERAVSLRVGAAVAVVIFVRGVRTLS